jgi:hypothetical protein
VSFRLRALCALAAATAAVLTPLVSSPASASLATPVGSTLHGADVSWPNCPTSVGLASRRGLGLPMPTTDARFVIVGLTNGPSFNVNPCLASQVAWARARHLWTGAYSIVSYPTQLQVHRYGGSGSSAQRLRRVGDAMAAYNVRTLRAANLRTPMVWVDVEPVRGYAWSSNASLNRALVSGVVNGLRARGVHVGLYSYAYGWKQITGGMQLPTLPTWVPAGSGYAQARARCFQRSFSGGPVWLGQYSDGTRDYDVTCPGVTGTATRRSLFPAVFAST